MPGRRSTIRYWPALSETTERTFSINAGLDASTVTPGSKAPVASLTAPVMEPWAKARAGRNTAHTRMNVTSLIDPRIAISFARPLEFKTLNPTPPSRFCQWDCGYDVAAAGSRLHASAWLCGQARGPPAPRRRRRTGGALERPVERRLGLVPTRVATSWMLCVPSRSSCFASCMRQLARYRIGASPTS